MPDPIDVRIVESGDALLVKFSKDQPILVNTGDINDLVDRVFFGIRYDFINDQLHVEKIEEDGTITLPEDGSANLDDYVGWFASRKYLSFQWANAISSNLLMEVA